MLIAFAQVFRVSRNGRFVSFNNMPFGFDAKHLGALAHKRSDVERFTRAEIAGAQRSLEITVGSLFIDDRCVGEVPSRRLAMNAGPTEEIFF